MDRILKAIKSLNGPQKRNSGTAEIVIKSPRSYQTIKPMADKEYSIEELFKALADRTRLRLINLMGDDEVCVCFFVEVLKLNQPKISRHLAYLREPVWWLPDEKESGCTTE